MTPSLDLDIAELGERIAYGGMWTAAHADPTPRLRAIARQVIVKDAARRPGRVRPRVIRDETILGGQS